ncbi:tetratricopeptide repeat-containing glycosyltransferase family 2 protein [Clostridium sp.]|uniref:tetratricopeptide repeat-containing glycosyltransferase family 2 protein n=1 Tax=Clostridium sp. TaxID=1506 RepID=UPI003F3E13FB
MDGIITVSLCMIVKDEEQTLERCLESVKDFVDEIIIVDTGSTDLTKEIARKYSANIYDFKWINDFAEARNYSFSKATQEYILWLDGDDYFDDENKKKLLELKKNISRSLDAINMNYSLSRDENGKTTYSLRRNRLVKRSNNFKWIGKIHEYLEVGGNTLAIDIAVNHGKIKSAGNRNLTIFRDMEKNKDKFTPRDLFYFGNELYHNGLFDEAIDKYEKFLDSGQGWVEDIKTATANLVQCYGATNQGEKKIGVILKSFEHDIPRAEVCCRLAECFLEKNQLKQCIFWYKIALGCKPEEGSLGINNPIYYTWIPTIQLCVCYSRLEDYETAYYYNELTAIYGGNADKVEHNRSFLKGKLKELGIAIPILDIGLFDRRYKSL